MSRGYAPRYEDQDYSESDCPSESPLVAATDVTELYRRSQARDGRNCYHTRNPGYYDGQSRLVPPACSCNLQLDPRYCCYNKEIAFKSSPHINGLKACRDSAMNKTIKKYPVTAKTPRYYRYLPPTLYKPPSTLCLPVTCQPDPATCRRSRKSGDLYRQDQANDVKATVKRTTTRCIGSDGDVNARLNDLENLLTKFDDDDEGGQEDEGNVSTELSDIVKTLKPKIPASIKAKRDQNSTLKLPTTSSKEPTFASQWGKLEVSDYVSRRLSSETVKDPINTGELPKLSAERPKATPSSKLPTLDDNSALELHRSKSYIVSLIDKALSKELGTVPGDPCSRKEFLSMNTKRAVNLVNRHTTSQKVDQNQVEAAAASGSVAKKECDVCNYDEPGYLKQLKALRWSHLMHIQREAKRLADLERFLDNFSDVDRV